MGLLVECPKCRSRNPEGTANCGGNFRSGERKGEKCGYSRLNKHAGKTYWIEYREYGKRKRERIGPSKTAAEARLLEVQKALVKSVMLSATKMPVSHSGIFSIGF